MKCSNEVVYKGIEERKGGVFKNDKGQDIKYDNAYVVRFDEVVEGNAIERKVKFDGKNISIYSKFRALKIYDKINVVFDVSIQNTGCKLTILDFNLVK